ncbi:hypothetical protein T310_8595, partial [Rasamsonia emersonii CBS 393.64]
QLDGSHRTLDPSQLPFPPRVIPSFPASYPPPVVVLPVGRTIDNRSILLSLPCSTNFRLIFLRPSAVVVRVFSSLSLYARSITVHETSSFLDILASGQHNDIVLGLSFKIVSELQVVFPPHDLEFFHASTSTDHQC